MQFIHILWAFTNLEDVIAVHVCWVACHEELKMFIDFQQVMKNNDYKWKNVIPDKSLILGRYDKRKRVVKAKKSI